METGFVSLDGGATTISSSSYSYGTPQFTLGDAGTSQYPSHDIYPTWFALSPVSGHDVDDDNEFDLPKTFTYDVVVAGFSWVHFDAFGYYEKVIKKHDKTISVFVPGSHDSEFVEAVPEPSSLLLLGSSLIGLAFWRRRSFIR
jgi:hypothetical protein